MHRDYEIVPLLQNTFILRRLRVANSVDIIKIATIIIKTTVKDSKVRIRIRYKM